MTPSTSLWGIKGGPLLPSSAAKNPEITSSPLVTFIHLGKEGINALQTFMHSVV